jgi:hypothetical protein
MATTQRAEKNVGYQGRLWGNEPPAPMTNLNGLC